LPMSLAKPLSEATRPGGVMPPQCVT
jgi:hypothetical protein